jgi:universal stress protein E
VYLDAYAIPNGTLQITERDIKVRCLNQLQKTAKRMQRLGIDVAAVAEWDFPSYEAIVRRARYTGADLIVADLHAGTHMAAGLLHIADWQLLRLSPIPVLLVKRRGRYREPVVIAALDPTHTREKPATLDNEILTAASTVADTLHGSLHALHAYIPAPPSIWPIDSAGAAALSSLQAQTAQKAKHTLDRTLRSTNIPPARRHLVGRHPIDAIGQTARQLRASIVVMGAVSRSGLKGLFIGNTAEQVLDQLACDLLVVKPASFKDRVPRASRGVKLRVPASAIFPG